MSTTKPATAKPVIKLSQTKTGPVYEQIKNAILHKVNSGTWQPGFRLPTLRELAVQLDVAYATVERAVRELTQDGVLEGRKRGGTRVAVRTRKQVGAIGVLGYADYGKLQTHSKYYSTFLMFLQEAIVQQGRMAVYDFAPSGKPMASTFNGLTHVDALVLFDPHGERAAEARKLLAMDIPVIAIGERTDEDLPSVASASLDDTYRATKHVIQLGHQHIAGAIHSFRPDSPANQLRLEGFRRALSELPQGFSPSQLVVGDPEQQAAGLLALTPAPTALFTPQTVHFGELYKRLKGTHLEPGKRTFIYTYDENLNNSITPLGFDFLSIEQQMGQLAATTVETVSKMIDDPAYRPGALTVPGEIYMISKRGVKTLID